MTRRTFASSLSSMPFLRSAAQAAQAKANAVLDPDRDRCLLLHTFANHVMDQRQDPMKATEFPVSRGLFNGIMVWVDLHKWCVARNRQGLRLYVANHSPCDALPMFRVLPELCGVKTSVETPASRELIEDHPILLVIRDGALEFELSLPAWEMRLLDIPATVQRRQ